MIFGEKSKIPIYFSIYPGSIPDKSYLDYMLRDTKSLGIECSKLVMDKGFFSEKNVKKLANETLSFIISLPNHYKISKQLISRNSQLQYDISTSLGSNKPYAKSEIINDYGFRAKVHIYYDSNKFTDESNILLCRLEERETVLRTLTKKPSKSALYDGYFNIIESEGNNLEVELDTQKINEKIKNFGYFLIMTTDFESSSEEILEIYRQKDVVEKCFDNLKNELDMNRLRTHSNETTDGKTFIAFIGLILRSILEKELKIYKENNNFTINKILTELSKIRIVTLSDGKKLVNPITKKQKDILSHFGLNETDILGKISTI